jgi:hypothetical protein
MLCMEEADGRLAENQRMGFLGRVFQRGLLGRMRHGPEEQSFEVDPSSPTATVALSKCDLHVLEMGQSCKISCIEGAAWVTYPGRFCDYILKAGESLSLRGEARIIISGGRDKCTVRISAK